MKTLILGIPLLIIIVILSIFVVPWVIVYVGNLFEPNPLRPEVTYEEFPFRLEYEIDGQKKFIQDTLIFEYKGVETNEGRGKYRKWEQRLASGNERITLLKVDKDTEIYYPPGSANYYMGDFGQNQSFNPVFPDAAYIKVDGKIKRNGVINAEDLLNLYNIKLISWDIAKPIINSFEEE